jgi:hypothetical protein
MQVPRLSPQSLNAHAMSSGWPQPHPPRLTKVGSRWTASCDLSLLPSSSSSSSSPSMFLSLTRLLFPTLYTLQKGFKNTMQSLPTPHNLAHGTTSPSIPTPTLTDKLGLIPHTFRVLTSLVLRLLTYPIRSGARASNLYKDVIFAAVRTNLTIINPAQEQYLNPPTEATYKIFCKGEKIEPQEDVLPESKVKLLWFGPKRPEGKVVLYLHGGGYVLSASPGHVRWLCEVQKELSQGGGNVSIVMPAYTLAPRGQYPQQLCEAVESLRFLLETLGKKPSDVSLLPPSSPKIPV